MPFISMVYINECIDVNTAFINECIDVNTALKKFLQIYELFG
jgi:hypothetical protein